MCRQVHPAVEGGAVDHAALLQHMLRQEGEDPAGGGVSPDVVVLIPGGEHRRHGPPGPLRQNGADGGAPAAADTGFAVDHRAGEALPVPDHGDGVVGADAGAGGAAGAAGWVRKPGQRPLRRRSGTGCPPARSRAGPPGRSADSPGTAAAPGRGGRPPPPSRWGPFSSAVSPLPMIRSARPSRLRRLKVRELSGAASSAGGGRREEGLAELGRRTRSRGRSWCTHRRRSGTAPETPPGRR